MNIALLGSTKFMSNFGERVSVCYAARSLIPLRAHCNDKDWSISTPVHKQQPDQGEAVHLCLIRFDRERAHMFMFEYSFSRNPSPQSPRCSNLLKC